MNASARVQGRNQIVPASRLRGVERAAVLMLALGNQHGQHIWSALDDDEVRALSSCMSSLGAVNSETVEDLLVDFVTRLSTAGGLMGTYESTERLLAGMLPTERVSAIMEEIRGPAGRNMWEKLSNVQEDVLANYLKNEYPQTVAVVLSKIRAEHAARVLANLPEDLALEVVSRMLRMEPVQKDILEKVEQTLRTEFMAGLAQTSRRDAHELMAEIFNNFDRQTEGRFISALEEDDRESADRIKSLMFTFEDLAKLDASSIQTLLRGVEKETLAVAMKGAPDRLREFFFQNMTSRAANNLKEDMEVMGPVRLRDVDQAQGHMIATAKDLAAKGDIIIAKNNGDDELIY